MTRTGKDKSPVMFKRRRGLLFVKTLQTIDKSIREVAEKKRSAWQESEDWLEKNTDKLVILG